MHKPLYPEVSVDAILAARAVLKAARLAAMRERRRQRRLHGVPAKNPFKTQGFLCGWCGVAFEARVLNRPFRARWCSHSCRENGYQARKRRADQRAAILSERGLR